MDQLDARTQARVHSYVDRVAAGGAKKNIRALGDGVFEIKIDFSPGIRVYFGEIGDVIILLLLGGDKGSQNRDIAKAKEYWRLYAQK
jgi:putative addiction module killer protein